VVRRLRRLRRLRLLTTGHHECRSTGQNHCRAPDFDLYSVGKDGASSKQITGAKGRDDIIRAGNGGFIGLAKDH
jgi:hypothetical protein